MRYLSLDEKNKIPEPPEDSRNLKMHIKKKLIALFQVFAVTAVVVISGHLLASWLGDVAFFEGIFSEPRQTLASAFTRSFIKYVLLITVLVFVFRNKAVKEALGSLRLPATRVGWSIALIGAVFQTAILVAMFIRPLDLIIEVSFFNLFMSLISAIGGGLGEETIFRGFIILTLAYAGFSKFSQAFLSGLLFGAVHFGWSMAVIDQNLIQVLSPLIGTFMLGVIFAIAFQQSNYRLMPVVVAHGLINIVIEPGLIVSYFG